MNRTISCYGNPGVSEAICDDTCSLEPGSSSYDPRTECMTEYGPEHGAGTTCAEALSDLEMAMVPPQDRCAPSDNDPSCKVCAKEACCSSLAACQEDSDCIYLLYCLEPCHGSAECVADCQSGRQGGVDLMDTYLGCIDESCADACAQR